MSDSLNRLRKWLARSADLTDEQVVEEVLVILHDNFTTINQASSALRFAGFNGVLLEQVGKTLTEIARLRSDNTH